VAGDEVADGREGDAYQLFAINGLGDEFYLGKTSDERPPSFTGSMRIYPVPFQGIKGGVKT